MQHLPQPARMRGVTISRVIRRAAKSPLPETAQDIAAVREPTAVPAAEVVTSPASKA